MHKCTIRSLPMLNTGKNECSQRVVTGPWGSIWAVMAPTISVHFNWIQFILFQKETNAIITLSKCFLVYLLWRKQLTKVKHFFLITIWVRSSSNIFCKKAYFRPWNWFLKLFMILYHLYKFSGRNSGYPERYEQNFKICQNEKILLLNSVFISLT